MLIPIDIEMLLVILLPLFIAIPVFWLIRKTLLKQDVPTRRPGPTPRRVLAFLIIVSSYAIPCAMLYHYWIHRIWW